MAVESGERQATGMAKAPYVAQFVRALLDAASGCCSSPIIIR